MLRRGLPCDECVRRCERYHKKKGGFSPVDARFFKVMFGEDYSKVMYLPPVFAKTVKYLTNKEFQIEDAQGDRWSVTLSRVKGSLAFKEGWQKFSEYHHLKEGDILIFSYMKGSHFTASVFGRSGCERNSFNKDMPRPSKRYRRDQETASEDEPYQTADVHSGLKPISGTSVASGDKSQRLKTKFAGANSDFGVSEHLPIHVNYEDSMCMTNWENRRYEEKDRNFLYDLSSFEMEKRTCGVKKTLKPLIVMLGPPQTETAHHDANLENAADTKASLSCIGIIEQTKPVGDDAMKQTETPMADAETSGIKTDLVAGNFADISTEKFEKAENAKKYLSFTEIKEQIRKKVHDSQMGPHSSQAGGVSRDTFTNNFYKKPSVNSNVKKSMLDNVCSQDGSSKVAEGEHAVKSKISAFRNSLGTFAVKKEMVEMDDKSNIFGRISCGGKEPPVLSKHAQVISPSPQVKIEPDLSQETNPWDAISSTFSAIVKSRFYLELPENIASTGRRKSRIEGMVVILRDSAQRLWPVIYREYYNGRALTVNWTQFCEQNNIMPGDKCRFLVEDVTQRIYRVDVAHGAG